MDRDALLKAGAITLALAIFVGLLCWGIAKHPVFALVFVCVTGAILIFVALYWLFKRY